MLRSDRAGRRGGPQACEGGGTPMTAVLVTRPARASDALVNELQRRGYDVIAVPTVVTRSVAVEWPDMATFDWVVLTSTTAAAALPDIPARPRRAAVGAPPARPPAAPGAVVDVT